MAEVKNSFIRSKMNKDLEARLIPSGEYRNAVNAQVSRSEGDDVGSLENVLGNKTIATFEPSVSNLSSIGYFVDESNEFIYIFLTDNSTENYIPTGTGSNHFIKRYNVRTNTVQDLASGAFLNFSKLYPINGINLLEDILFFTDYRNQPRRINTSTAALNPYFYNNEDKVSVAKYNPWQPILLYKESDIASGEYETTMKDVVSKFLPDGGIALCNDVTTNPKTTFDIDNLNIKFYPTDQTSGTVNVPQTGMTVAKIDSGGNFDNLGGAITVSSYTPSTDTSGTLVLSGSVTIENNDEIIFNYNPYYDQNYAGDDDFLSDKFVRFSYRFKFSDGEYSLIAPFTQPVFIPKQDGYFLNTSENEGDQQQTFSSTIVSFMENKVNEVDLQIKLPSTISNLTSSFDITEMDIIYKESDGLALQVVETIYFSDIVSSDDLYVYKYTGQKPYKTLPEREIIRVYDKIPVKAFTQEIISNRVVYGNFQNKHTPPNSIDYYVAANTKSAFNLQNGSATVDGDVVDSTTIIVDAAVGNIVAGSTVSGTGVLADTIITNVTGTLPNLTITVNQNQNLSNDVDLLFNIVGDDGKTTSYIEYPSHSVKQNRSYQVGVVLSDRYGRSSSVILTNNKEKITVGGITYSGSTLYLPYIDEGVNQDSWPGHSLKVSFNSPISGSGEYWPGLYNGDVTSEDYNPLGWYTYKVVVKQLEQEYYNVYTAGAMKGQPYWTNGNPPVPTTTNPPDQSSTFIVLINDNINKVPRDLSEVGAQDKQYRSSVRLFGRVENSSSAYSNVGNRQYYPNKIDFTVNQIADLFSSFDVLQFTGGGTSIIPVTCTNSPYYAFFRAESNPFVAEFVTSQIPTEQFGLVNDGYANTATIYNKFLNLNILETSPVISRINIFYETTTAGIINDLNNAILNESGGGAGFSSFNTSAFLESLNSGEDILSGDFTLVDNFGADITLGVGDTFEITSIYNTESTPQDVSTYFTLTGNQTIGWNIQTTSSFLSNVYYGSNQGQRVFNFTFTSVIAGVTTVYNKQAVLSNVVPVVTPSSNLLSSVPVNNIIQEMTAVNGANSLNPNRGSDLTWTIDSITKDGSPFSNSPQQFGLTTYTETPSRCELKNVGGTVPLGTYVITVKCEDAGGLSDTCVVTLDLGVDPTSVIEYTDTMQCQGESTPDSWRYVVIFVEDHADPSKNGYYLYYNDWTTLSSGVTNIQLDYTNATKSGTDPCGYWYFASTLTAARDLFYDCYTCYVGQSVSRTVAVINTSGYTFEVI